MLKYPQSKGIILKHMSCQLLYRECTPITCTSHAHHTPTTCPWFDIPSSLHIHFLHTAHVIALGYSIFVVIGALPPCEADQLLTLIPIKPEPPTASPTPGGQPSCTGCTSKKGRTSEIDDEDESFALDLATAMSASLLTTAVTAQEQGGTRPCELREMEEKEERGCTSKRGRTSEIDGEDESFALDLATAMSASLVKTTVTAQEQGGTVAARPCGLREVEEKEEPDLELATASLDGRDILHSRTGGYGLGMRVGSLRYCRK